MKRKYRKDPGFRKRNPKRVRIAAELIREWKQKTGKTQVSKSETWGSRDLAARETARSAFANELGGAGTACELALEEMTQELVSSLHEQ